MQLELWHAVAAVEASAAVGLAVAGRRWGSVFKVIAWTLFWTQAVSSVVFSAGAPPNVFFPLFVLPAAFLLCLRCFDPFLLKSTLAETDDERAYRYRPFPIFRRRRLKDVERF